MTIRPNLTEHEIKVQRLKAKISLKAREMDRYAMALETAEDDDERNFYALRISLKQQLIDSYNSALVKLEQA